MKPCSVNFELNGSAIVDFGLKYRYEVGMKTFSYQVDTGSAYTTISMKALNKLGYDRQWVMENGKLIKYKDMPKVATGTPVKDCYKIAIPQINIGHFVGYNWPFMTSLSTHLNLLLGTDTMRYFNWQFNYESNTCIFDLIPGMRNMDFGNEDQSIHSLT